MKRTPRTVKAILKAAGLPVRKGRRKKARGPSVKTAKGAVIPQADLKGPGLGGPNLKVTRKRVPSATPPHDAFEMPGDKPLPPFPAHVERDLTEEAEVQRRTRGLLVQQALTDRLAVAAAQLAYEGKGSIVIRTAGPAETRIFEQLVENVERLERIAVLKIVMEWAQHHNISLDARAQLDALVETIRGDVSNESIKDNVAVGQNTADGFFPLRAEPNKKGYPRTTRLERIGAPQALTLKMEWTKDENNKITVTEGL